MTEPPKLYGVWIPREGWLKSHNGAVAFVHQDIAVSIARRVGKQARAEYIDDSLKDLEQQLLLAEQEQAHKTIWKRLQKFFRK